MRSLKNAFTFLRISSNRAIQQINSTMFDNILKNIDRIWSKADFVERLIFIKMDQKTPKVIFLRFYTGFCIKVHFYKAGPEYLTK